MRSGHFAEAGDVDPNCTLSPQQGEQENQVRAAEATNGNGARDWQQAGRRSGPSGR